MVPRTLSHAVLAAGAAAALGLAAVPAANADPVPAPPTASRALLPVAIGGPIGALLQSTTPTTVLTDGQIATVVDGLPGLTAAQVTAVVDALSGPQLADLLGGMTPAQVADLTQTLDPQAVTDLLGGLAGTPEAPASFAAVLGGLGSSAGSLVDGLLAGGAGAPDASQVGALLEHLRALLGAGVPTGDPAVAQGLADVIDRVTQLLGVDDVVNLPVLGPLLSDLLDASTTLPEPVGGAVDGLISTLRGVPGSGPLLEGLGLQTTGGAAGAGGTGTDGAGGTGGTGSSGGSGSAGSAGGAGGPGTAGTAGAGGPGPGVPAGSVAAVPKPTPAKGLAGATIRSISITKDRRRIRVRLTCPKTAKAACVVTTSVTVRGASVAKGRKITVKKGKTRTLTVKVATGRARIVRRSGGRVVVRASTKGATTSAARKTRTVRRTAR